MNEHNGFIIIQCPFLCLLAHSLSLGLHLWGPQWNEAGVVDQSVGHQPTVPDPTVPSRGSWGSEIAKSQINWGHPFNYPFPVKIISNLVSTMASKEFSSEFHPETQLLYWCLLCYFAHVLGSICLPGHHHQSIGPQRRWPRGYCRCAPDRESPDMSCVLEWYTTTMFIERGFQVAVQVWVKQY